MLKIRNKKILALVILLILVLVFGTIYLMFNRQNDLNQRSENIKIKDTLLNKEKISVPITPQEMEIIEKSLTPTPTKNSSTNASSITPKEMEKIQKSLTPTPTKNSSTTEPSITPKEMDAILQSLTPKTPIK